jgi:hypothetical protein
MTSVLSARRTVSVVGSRIWVPPQSTLEPADDQALGWRHADILRMTVARYVNP